MDKCAHQGHIGSGYLSATLIRAEVYEFEGGCCLIRWPYIT